MSSWLHDCYEAIAKAPNVDVETRSNGKILYHLPVKIC